jgi:hypothetical protein
MSTCMWRAAIMIGICVCSLITGFPPQLRSSAPVSGRSCSFDTAARYRSTDRMCSVVTMHTATLVSQGLYDRDAPLQRSKFEQR